MEVFVFSGKIVPGNLKWSVRWSSEVECPDLNLGKMKISIQYENDSVTAILEVPSNYPKIDLYTFRNMVERIAKSHVDSVGYLEGFGFEVFISKVLKPDGKEENIFLEIPDLRKIKDDLFFANKHIELMKLVDKYWQLENALTSFRLAIREHGHTGAYCFRALESLRHYFVESESKKREKPDDSDSWRKMATKLNLHRSLSDEMTMFAFPQRHGEIKANLDLERSILLRRTSAIIDRFCIYVSKEKTLKELGYTVLKCDGKECLDPSKHSD